ncbi:MAG: hypothetical protein U1B78_06940 [Dehalococcoidia bacterium]|nr:hypothetical protein [Dehalococcoidia bacterium]
MLSRTLIATLAGSLVALGVASVSLAGTPPAAPSDLSFDGVDSLTWTDNSGNEDGYRIVVSIAGGPFEYQTGPNETSLSLPPEALIQCPERQDVTYEVSAFNAAGESESVVLGIAADCSLQSPPAAPSNANLVGGVLSWVDNSDTEDGFRITVRIGGETLEYQVGPDVTSFVIPPEAQLQCPDRATVTYDVSAFNGFGASESVGIGISAICPETFLLATPTIVPRALPPAGNGAESGTTGRPPLLWLALAAVTVVAGGLLAWRIRVR